ncbi:MAG: flavodoxin-dependent (E)-4-hydroxy-3-methylbut-2-enyl-diphosphate synthase [Candidatus Omnitrophica bacterium]|nr:flavodoxin-dependent (E)-4-hydroxy-3-methylbut-2-enyl-diphosphate synthase [Candidatus Omnitrophota bacterium]
MKRRKTRQVKIGDIYVGGDAPISIQSMTKTDTCHVDSTLNEIRKLKKSGCEIVRIAVKDNKANEALRRIIQRSELPVVADIHFNPGLAIDAIDAGVQALRLNPGNINKKDDIKHIIDKAKTRSIPIRIGVNTGSLTTHASTTSESMVKSAVDYIKIFEECAFRDIIISLKSSNVEETVEAYREMSRLCDYPMHLGVTAAGPLVKSIVKSSLGIGTLLNEGIGDTIRVSLTGSPITEVEIAKEILAATGRRHFGPEIISCPTCGRCEIDLCGVVEEFKERLKELHLGDKISNMKIAIMGCVVNGPGEAKEADIGIAGGKESAVLFRKGKKIKTISEKEFVDTLIEEIKNFNTNES